MQTNYLSETDSIMKKLICLFAVFLMLCGRAFALDANDLLPPEKAFVPELAVADDGVNVRFRIADGYYMYQAKIVGKTDPADLLGQPSFSKGEEKEDEFFGRQTVYHHEAQVAFPYAKAVGEPYKLVLTYQGCAEAGVCYPPVDTEFDIFGNGTYHPQTDEPASAKDRFLQPSSQNGSGALPPPKGDEGGDSRFKLSWDTLNANLLAFFLAGLGLSFTACMYPLLPIVSSIVVGDKKAGKARAFVLSVVYVQGLALTYTLVGIVAGLTGALLTVWLQQAWVVLAASALMVVLALSMFGLFNIQLPNAVQSYFQNQSSRLSGGKIVSVFIMGILSALIVGPCVAPPLAFALGYIGQTGDAVLGGLALYTLALGTGVPLIAIGTFGGHILPKAGDWMNAVKYAFGFILLAVAVYLATPHLPYYLVVALYTLLMLVPAFMLLVNGRRQKRRPKAVAFALGGILLIGGAWFGWQGANGKTTALHHFLTLNPPAEAGKSSEHGKMFADTAALKAAMDTALKEHPDKPVVLDFYADWCISCKEMAAYTLNQPEVHQAVDMERFFQIDVTANMPEHQALLKEYGLFGPPGVFVVRSDGSRSEPLLGFVKADKFIEWYEQNR